MLGILGRCIKLAKIRAQPPPLPVPSPLIMLATSPPHGKGEGNMQEFDHNGNISHPTPNTVSRGYRVNSDKRSTLALSQKECIFSKIAQMGGLLSMSQLMRSIFFCQRLGSCIRDAHREDLSKICFL